MAKKKESKTNAFFETLTEEQVERFEAMMGEYEAAEKRTSEQVEHSIDEMARLWKSSFSYMLELNEQTRSMWFDSARQAMGWMSRKSA